MLMKAPSVVNLKASFYESINYIIALHYKIVSLQSYKISPPIYSYIYKFFTIFHFHHLLH